LGRLRIDYRPLRKDAKDEGRVFPEAVTNDDVVKAEADFLRLANDEEFGTFVRCHTNWEVIRRGNAHEPVDFSQCGFSTIYRLIRANGEVRPCCMRIGEPEFYLGNVLRDAPESIAMNVLFNAQYLRPGCDGPGCKLCRTNRLIEDGIAGRIEPSTIPAVAAYPFFG
jgi:sulfatase maturation enzyme AslB (radical SAM superfamily)